MKRMERYDFVLAVKDCRKRNPGIRNGQAVCAVAYQLFEMCLHVASALPEADPFYEDKNIPAFLEHLVKIGCLES
jgi:hypothetical protein